MYHHDKLGDVRVESGVVFVATLNEGFEYTGVDPVDEALRDRFYQFELGYLPEVQEVALVIMRAGISPEDAQKLVQFCNKLRLNTREAIHISTRKCIMMAELVASRLPMQEAIKSQVGVDKDKLESILLELDLHGQLKTGTGIRDGWELL
jgi:MoxR-like ATPase